MRLFIAIDVPEEIKNKAVAVSEEIGKLQGRFVPVKREAMHITLNFIGEVGENMAAKAKEALDAVAFTPFGVTMKGVSYFSLKFIRVVFIGVGEGNEELKRLYYVMCEALENAGVAYEKEDYEPHLTISRVKYIGDKQQLLGLIGKYSGEDFGSFTARAVSLKKSVLEERGPQYSELHKIEF